MTRIATILLCLATVVGLSACKAKPSEEACEDAIENVREITGLDETEIGDPKAAVRSCQANSSKETVECMRKAKTLEDVIACEGEEGKKYFEEAEKAQQKLEEESESEGE